MSLRHLLLAVLPLIPIAAFAQAAPSPDVDALVKEIHDKGWLVYGARSDNGTWDLFLSRPDGSDKRNITNSADYEEAAPRFSPDGTKLFYRRMPRGTKIDHDKWGFMGELILADADGSNPAPFGKEGEYPWATWSPDGKQVVCLFPKGIKEYDLASKAVTREFPRQGIYQQLYWSPDGKWFCGVANNQGEQWTVVRVNAQTGELNPVRRYQNCTPD